MASYAGTVAGARTATMVNIIREHLLDVVCMISPNRTPLLSILAKFQARDMQVDWIADLLGNPGDPALGNANVQAVAEDTDASFAQVDGPYRLCNRIHHFRETMSATDKLDYVDTVDTESVYATQLAKKIKEQAQKIEFAFIHSQGTAAVGSGNAASPGHVAPRMFGIQQIARGIQGGRFNACEWDDLPDDLQGTWHDVTESPCKHFLETHLGDLLAAMRAKGAEPTDLWLPINQKRQLSDFSGASTRNIEAEDRALIHTIDVYEGPTGVIIANLHDYVEPTAVIATQTDLLEIAILKPTIAERLARIGDAFKGMVETSLTLVVRCPSAIGKITGLCPSYELVSEEVQEEQA